MLFKSFSFKKKKKSYSDTLCKFRNIEYNAFPPLPIYIAKYTQ